MRDALGKGRCPLARLLLIADEEKFGTGGGKATPRDRPGAAKQITAENYERARFAALMNRSNMTRISESPSASVAAK